MAKAKYKHDERPVGVTPKGGRPSILNAERIATIAQRVASGYTHAEAARAAGVDPARLSAWLRNRSGNPMYDTLRDTIADAVARANDLDHRRIPSFPDYAATSDGHIVNLITGTTRATTDKHGYAHVLIKRDGRPIKRGVHQLACEAWHGPRPPGHECRHLDGDKTNNRPENLRWGTRQENRADRYRHGTVGTKLSDIDARAIRHLREHGVTTTLLAEAYGIGAAHVSAIATGRSMAHTAPMPDLF